MIASTLQYIGSKLLTVGCVGSGLVTILAALIYWKQNLLLYVSYMPAGARTHFPVLPNQYGLLYEDVWLVTKDGVKIHCWFIPHTLGVSERPTFIFFHGNAGNISYRCPNLQAMHNVVGANILIVSYRGYGKSEGEPSEEGLKIDSKASLDYLLSREDVDKSKIFVFGASLGAAVALDLVTSRQDQIRGVVIENGFTSVSDMIDVAFRALTYFKFLSRNLWDNSKAVLKLKVPILFMSAGQDEIVPARMMKALYDACSSPDKEFKLFPDGTHNEVFMQAGYYEKIHEWVERRL